MFISFLDNILNPDTTIVSFLLSFTALIILFSALAYESIYTIRVLSLILSMYPLLWALTLWFSYDASGSSFHGLSYIGGLHLSFGVDAMGLSLVVLTTGLFPICIMLMRTFSGIMVMLLLELVILGALLVLDLLGFYILFEASLVLLFLLVARPRTLFGNTINNQNNQRASYGSIEAAYYIVLYTMAGSLAFLPVIFVIYSLYGSTNLLVLATVADNLLTVDRQMVLGWGFFAVFCVKLPLMPVHLWLPAAHVASPTSGSILLAGVLLKLGGLGIIRYMLPIVPAFVESVFPLIVCMCLASFLFSTLSTIRQVDLKKIVAYSSIAHMSLVTLAIFSTSEHSVFAASFMMIAHGLVSPALFLLVGLLYERTHTKFLPYYSGLGTVMPVFSTIFFLLTCANLAFPLFPNFIAEVLCLASIFALHPLFAYIFCAGQVLGAVYGFWAFNRAFHGLPSSSFTTKGFVADLSRREIALTLPLLVAIIWLGIAPMA